MMDFNFFGSMTKLHLIGKGRSNSRVQKNKATTSSASYTSVSESVAINQNHVSETEEKRRLSDKDKSEDGNKSSFRKFLSLNKLPTTEAEAVKHDAVANEPNITEDEEVEARDKFEMTNTTFYKVLTKSFYDEHLDQLTPFRKQDGQLQSSTKREKKTTKTLRQRKLVISSPQDFQRVENEFTMTLRREADKIGSLKKSVSLDNLLRDSEDYSATLDRGKLKFESEESLHSSNKNNEVVNKEQCFNCGEYHQCQINNDDNSSSSESDDNDENQDNKTNMVVMRNMSQSTPELLKSINQVPRDPQERPTENKFPLDADDVEIRRKPEFRTNRISKTTDFDAGRRRQTIPVNPKNFEIRGILKIEFLSNISLIKLKEEYIVYENENLFRVNDKSKTKELLASNVIIKSVRYPKSKESKEVELRDTKDVIYLLHFQELKYAKQFMENEKVQVYITDNKVTIKKTLLRFLGKRSSREILEKKGIYRNEPIFGNTLRDIYNKSLTNSLVPTFIIEVIKLLEKPENIKSLGVYRTSGNLAIIQKIRFEVDNGRLSILGQYAKDPDVLTGSLKLFFRELKEPLIQREVCDKLLEYISAKEPKQMLSKDHQKIRSILVKNLHEANLETFVVIINHLLEVIKYKEINKMDAYNLAICWGPSMIFSVQGANISAISDISRDIVTQSHNATRMVDFFLNYYHLFPAELLTLGKRSRPESISEKVYLLKRQESKDSVGSSDSSKTQKKSASSLSLSVDDVTKKLIEFIEPHLNSEGLYRKMGSADKTNKIMKKLTKRKINELEKYKNDVYELADALKKYLKEQDCLVYEDTVELVLRVAPDSSQSCLEPTTRQKVISLIEDTPKKDTMIFLLQHLAKALEIQENKYNVPRYELVGIWANVLNNPKKTKRSNEDFSRFLDVAIKVFNDNLPDIVRSSVNNNGCSPVKNRSMDELMKEMKHQQAERDRNSRYDNVDSDVGEASILEDKTEQTKL